MADLPDSLTDTHNHPGLFQLVQGTLTGLGASGERRRYLHDGETDKQNPVAVLGSPCQDFIQQAGVLAIINSQFIDLCPPFGSFG